MIRLRVSTTVTGEVERDELSDDVLLVRLISRFDGWRPKRYFEETWPDGEMYSLLSRYEGADVTREKGGDLDDELSGLAERDGALLCDSLRLCMSITFSTTVSKYRQKQVCEMEMPGVR
jgi:hypothetical protein